MTIEVVRYREEHGDAWNRFVSNSKNGTFLFNRGFMEYHADRFEDHSLLFHADGQLIAVLPANRSENTAVSHGGLSYGGIVVDRHMQAGRMLEVADSLVRYYRAVGVRALLYKPVPHIYHRQPAEEDLYALFRVGAELSRVEISTTIDLATPLPLAKGKRYGLSKARKAGVSVRRSEDYAEFWGLLESVLNERHGVSPTHSLSQIRLLAARFPDNIALYVATVERKLLAGTVVFVSDTVAHTQYMATSETGREISALDAVIHHIVSNVYHEKRYFDFGISTQSEGRLLNEGLCRQKEAFGGRGTVRLVYRLDLG